MLRRLFFISLLTPFLTKLKGIVQLRKPKFDYQFLNVVDRNNIGAIQYTLDGDKWYTHTFNFPIYVPSSVPITVKKLKNNIHIKINYQIGYFDMLIPI